MHMRSQLLEDLAGRIAALSPRAIIRIAIDGVDGAGKTTFADELAAYVEARGRKVIRASVDEFHNPRSIRYRLGRSSAEGFYYDSYNYAGLKKALLDPLSPGGSKRYRLAIFDHMADTQIAAPEFPAEEDSILILDGIFLHRPELQEYWDFSIFLDVAFDISIPRGAQRGPGYGSPDPDAESNRRYIEGQKLYMESCQPQLRATLVIDNNELSSPRITAENP